MSFWRRLLGDRDERDGGGPPPAVDAGPSMGEQLCAQRTALGLSLAEVERDIRINRLYLAALEDDDFEVLPAPVYARGFMRSYARYLGLDPEEAVAAVPRNLPRPSGLEPLPGLRRASAPALPALTPGVRMVALAAAAVALIAIAWLALGLRGEGEPGLSIATATPGPGATSSAGGAAPPPVGTATPAAGGAPASATVPPFTPGTAPDFRGVPREVAVSLSESLELVPFVVEETNPAPAGTVFDQSPPPGSDVQQNDIVTLFVSTGPGG